ncbi:iron dicitrate transport regulator FecR [Rhodoblastus sphagnicola]|uniref:Iron dicitrate transport regulator FecR n=1 Tax=Rhodoblastus sphagnicola TaxID=333368 RepID=A0A2S6NAW3_9HYPH|nr:transmembrane sensor [Rhodoblastus sphagnicola]PPQ31749.1 iron dicitrate transport regulator FecR [Rhodoblastus sphagnicola]
MNHRSESPEADLLLDEAIAWIVRLKTGEPTRADVETFERWRDQSPAHMEAFKRAAWIHRNAGVVAGRLAMAASATSAPSPAPSRRMSRRMVLAGGLAAAAVAGFAVVEPPMGLWPSLRELSADYRTGKGEQRKILLASNVSLDLNTQTSIALRSAQGQPTIELISGEVLVSAQHSLAGAVVVQAAGGQIVADEASFNAVCLDGVVSVTCLNGSAAVQHSGQSSAIGEGQQIVYSRAGIGAVASVDPAEVTAWQAGLLIFRERLLASVVEEVNRYRAGKIVIVNADLRQRIVNADFEIKKLDSFVAQVQRLFGARATWLPGDIVLLS